MKAEAPDWRGRTVVCIASGPSLTQEDCDLVQLAGHPAVVTNASYRLAPWADVLFGFDRKWWTHNLEEVRKVFKGRIVSQSQMAPSLKVETTHASDWFRGFGNSGVCAIMFAIGAGARKVVLVGFDCQKTGGRTHWHGDHPKGLSNAASIDKWPQQFKTVSRVAAQKGVRIVNCSRATALNCFERGELAKEL